MIKKIKIKNFKSFKDEVTIDISQEKSVVAILGRNASGKSTIFEVLSYVKGLFKNIKNIQECYKPYAFDKDFISAPCEFTIIGTIEDQEYSYFIKFDKEKIHQEYLNNRNCVFKRDDKIYINNSQIPLELPIGYSDLSAFYILLIMLPALQDVDDEFKKVLTTINDLLNHLHIELINVDSQTILKEEKYAIQQNLKDIRISKLASGADPTLLAVISEISLQEACERLDDTTPTEDKDSEISELIDLANKTDSHDLKQYDCITQHIVDSKIATLDYKEESDGTKKLFRLLPTLLEILDNGGYFFIDELDSKIHPTLIAEMLIPLFVNRKTNPYNAKLIFSMHNIGLLLYKNFLSNTMVLGINVDDDTEKTVVKLDIKTNEDVEKLINNFYGVTPIILQDDIEW